MCSGSETGSYLRLIDFVYHSTLGFRVTKKKKGRYVKRLWPVAGFVLIPFRALPTETKVESGTSQSKSGTSVNLSNSGNPSDSGRATSRLIVPRLADFDQAVDGNAPPPGIWYKSAKSGQIGPCVASSCVKRLCDEG